MKKGFTLIELLAAIFILSVIMLIIIPLITKEVQKSSEVANTQNQESIILSSRNWSTDHKNLLPQVGMEVCISVRALMDEGYLDNPKEKYLNGSVIINNDHDTYYYKLQKKDCDNKIELYKQVTFDYQTNGGTVNNITQEFLPGDKISYPNQKGNKNGYEFVGWNTNPKAHNGFESYTMPSHDVTLYAIYAKKINANFVLQKMKGAEDLETSKTTSTLESCMLYNMEEKCQITAPILTSVPGSKVIGWNSDPKAVTAEVNSGEKIQLTGDRTYYSIVEKTDYEVPECTLSISSGEFGKNNWYISDVGIHMDAKDIGEAGLKQYGLTTTTIATYNSLFDIVHTKDGKNIIYYGYVRDGVGNVNQCSISFKRDTVKPVITSVTNSSNSKWTNKTVTIKANLKDETSGIDQVYYYYGDDNTKRSNWSSKTATSVTGTWAANQNKIIYIYAEDKAGHVSNVINAGKIMIDKTPPTCKLSIASGTKGNNNWYTSNVKMQMTKNDSGGSEVNSYGVTNSATASYNSQTTYTHSSDTTGITYYGYVKDAAGNTNKCSVWFKRDATKPHCYNDDCSQGDCGLSSGGNGFSSRTCGSTFWVRVYDNMSGVVNAKSRHCYHTIYGSVAIAQEWGPACGGNNDTEMREWLKNNRPFRNVPYLDNYSDGYKYAAHGLNAQNARIVYQFQVTDAAGNSRDCGTHIKSFNVGSGDCPGGTGF